MEQLQPGGVVRDGLDAGEAAHGVLARERAEADGAREVAAALEVLGHLDGARRGVLAPVAQQQLPGPPVELAAARCDEVLVEHALVEAVREAVARPERAVGKLLLAAALEHPAHSAEPLHPLLELELVSARETACDRARELLAEDARGGEQLALGCGQRREVRAHQVLHVLRGLEVERLERPRELEAALAAARCRGARRAARRGCARRAAGPRRARGAAAQVRQRNRCRGSGARATARRLGRRAGRARARGRALRCEVEHAAVQRRVRRLDFGGAAGAEEQDALARGAPPEVAEHLHAHRVGPLQVLEQQHDGVEPRRGLHEVARLADQPLARRARRLAVERSVGIGHERGRHQHADRGRPGLDELDRLLAAAARAERARRARRGTAGAGRAAPGARGSGRPRP